MKESVNDNVRRRGNASARENEKGRKREKENVREKGGIENVREMIVIDVGKEVVHRENEDQDLDHLKMMKIM